MLLAYDWAMHGFLKIYFVDLCACVSKLIATILLANGMMQHDMDLNGLIKHALQLSYGSCSQHC